MDWENENCKALFDKATGGKGRKQFADRGIGAERSLFSEERGNLTAVVFGDVGVGEISSFVVYGCCSSEPS